MSYTLHWHVVCRTRPECVEALSDEEVVRRWLKVFPKKRGETQKQITESIRIEVQNTVRVPERVAELRERLSSISWLMKAMNESIARRSNAEDQVKGRFWEGRFRCQRLDDEASILACMVYVDLNPVRASIAESIEDSEFTSVYDRLKSTEGKQTSARIAESVVSPVGKQVAEIEKSTQMRCLADWLVDLDGSEGPIDGLTAERYLKLVDSTGRCMHPGKRGLIDPSVRPILEALELDVEEWVNNVQKFGSLFSRIACKAERLVDAAKEAGVKWFKGRKGSEQLFKQPATPQ